LEDFQHIVVEGDAKLCFDTIGDRSVAWSIGFLIDNIGDMRKKIIPSSFFGLREMQILLPMPWQNLLHPLVPFPLLFFFFNKYAIPQVV
jgi:hypothetical protein